MWTKHIRDARARLCTLCKITKPISPLYYRLWNLHQVRGICVKIPMVLSTHAMLQCCFAPHVVAIAYWPYPVSVCIPPPKKIPIPNHNFSLPQFQQPPPPIFPLPSSPLHGGPHQCSSPTKLATPPLGHAFRSATPLTSHCLCLMISSCRHTTEEPSSNLWPPWSHCHGL